MCSYIQLFLLKEEVYETMIILYAYDYKFHFK